MKNNWIRKKQKKNKCDSKWNVNVLVKNKCLLNFFLFWYPKMYKNGLKKTDDVVEKLIHFFFCVMIALTLDTVWSYDGQPLIGSTRP